MKNGLSGKNLSLDDIDIEKEAKELDKKHCGASSGSKILITVDDVIDCNSNDLTILTKDSTTSKLESKHYKANCEDLFKQNSGDSILPYGARISLYYEKDVKNYYLLRGDYFYLTEEVTNDLKLADEKFFSFCSSCRIYSRS